MGFPDNLYISRDGRSCCSWARRIGSAPEKRTDGRVTVVTLIGVDGARNNWPFCMTMRVAAERQDCIEGSPQGSRLYYLFKNVSEL